MLRLGLICVLSGALSAATYVSTASGTWSSAATWGGAGVPGDGDTAVIASGTTVTVTGAVTVGSKTAAAGHAITIQGNNATTYGTLVVSAGATLNLKGYDRTNNTLMLIQQYAWFEPAEGATITGDVPVDFGSVIVNKGNILADGSGGAPIHFTSPAGAFNWNNVMATETKANLSGFRFDNNRGMLLLDKLWIADATGTGIGSYGNSSLGILSQSPANTLVTEVASIDQVNGPGKYYLNYEQGELIYWYTSTAAPSFSFSYKYGTLLRGWGIQSLQNTPYNQAIFRNCVFTYMGSTLDQDYWVVDFNYKNSAASAANRLMAVSNCTFRHCGRNIGLKNVNGTAADPVQIENNVFDATWGSSGYGWTIGTFRANNSYVSIAGNSLNIRWALYNYAPPYNTTPHTNPGLMMVNNTGWANGLFSQNGSASLGGTAFPGFLIANNVITGGGYGMEMPGTGGAPRMIVDIQGAPGNPVLIQNNTFKYLYRMLSFGSYVTFQDNLVMYNFHHGVFAADNEDVYITGITVQRNVFAGTGSFDHQSVETGYNHSHHIDNVLVAHNTAIQPYGLLSFGDDGDGGNFSTLATRIVSRDNLVLSSNYGASRSVNTSGYRWTGLSVMQDNHNWYYGPGTVYRNYNRGGTFLWSGGEYNASATRKVTGISLWDPSDAGASNGNTLAYTVAGSTDVRLSWNGGPERQLLWKPQVYTASAAASGAGGQIPAGVRGTITIDSAAWNATVGDANCPRGMWVKMLSGSGAGQVRAVTSATSTRLTVVPDWDTVPSPGDTFVIYMAEVRLSDGAGNSVAAGVDARYLPAVSAVDTGISIAITDQVGVNPMLANGGNANDTNRAGYAPTNPALRGQASDGADPGALPVTSLRTMSGIVNNPPITF